MDVVVDGGGHQHSAACRPPCGRRVRARLVLPRDSIAYRPNSRGRRSSAPAIHRPAAHPHTPASRHQAAVRQQSAVRNHHHRRYWQTREGRKNTKFSADCTACSLFPQLRAHREENRKHGRRSERCRLGAGRGRPQPERPLHSKIPPRPGCPRAAREEAAQWSVRPPNTSMSRLDNLQTTTSARTCHRPPRKLAPSSRRSASRSSKPCGPRNMRTAWPAPMSTSSRA